MKKIKRETICHLVAATFSFAIVAPTVALIVDREPCYTITDGRPTPNPIKVGQGVDMRYVIKVDRPGCVGEFYRVIRDASGLTWTTERNQITFGNLSAGIHHTSHTVPMPIPKFSDEITVYSVMEQRRLSNPFHLIWPVVYQGPKFKIQVVQNGAQ